VASLHGGVMLGPLGADSRPQTFYYGSGCRHDSQASKKGKLKYDGF
jgi:hypothetical protein